MGHTLWVKFYLHRQVLKNVGRIMFFLISADSFFYLSLPAL